MERPASRDSTRYAPLPSGGSSVVFSKSRLLQYARDSTGSWPTISGSSRLSPGANAKRTFRSPTFSALVTCA